MFAPLWWRATVYRGEGSRCPADGWAVVASSGVVYVHPTRRADPQHWMYVFAHCLLHLGLEHFKNQENPRAWNVACDCAVTQFLRALKFGRVPDEMSCRIDPPASDENRLYRHFVENGIPPDFEFLGTAGRAADMVFDRETPASRYFGSGRSWQDLLKDGISAAVSQAVEVAAGNLDRLGGSAPQRTNAQLARNWFINSYPLLGALAEAFDLVEDAIVCQRREVSVAAIDIEGKEILVNPAAALSLQEARFVLAHEMLHAGLRHDQRRRGRDLFLWNVACDYVINGWLIEMQIGDVPRFGVLYDPELKGLSAESIYDRIVTDLRKYRKLATFAGLGRSDILDPGMSEWWAIGIGVGLDGFYRSCLAQGLMYHEQSGRGLLPAGLIEEIRALQQPPIAWEVELAQWFDGYFSPIEKRRTYARPSRRQSATPDIPRPRWYPAEDSESGRTFGVVIDTSGSMDTRLLGKALGAVASYAVSRDVPAVRVIFCDAAAYDQGFMAPDAIVERVKVRGRGGTVLQPGITLLEKAADFPKNGPILVITDGLCDTMRIRRQHAFLLPLGHSLPFIPRGPVFRMS